MRSARRSALLVALLVCLAAASASGAAAAGRSMRAPTGFFGVVPQEPPSAAEFGRMRGTVETVRMPIDWFEVETGPGEYDFEGVDAEIGAAAEAGIRVMPFVYGRPGWLGAQNRAPLDGEALVRWKAFLEVLVGRYGPGGTFWIGRKELAIRRWQVWNEPNFRLFWAPRVEPEGYAKLLRVSAGAIRGVDPGAKIVLAGIAPVGAGMKTWVFMRRLLRVPGVRADFDYAALHPYSANIPELDYQLEKVRAAMAAGGAGRKPLIVTEIGVASWGSYPSAFVEGEEGQAAFLHEAYERLLWMRRRWRIAGAYWFTWRDVEKADPHCSFCQGAGLLRPDGTAKPAWFALRRIAAESRR
jgi:polysaccharide biosynthesis protein PslG